MSKAFSELKLDRSVIDTRSYDDGGRMTSAVLGNGITETRAYRTDNLLSTISFSNTNIGNLGYSWDANKNKTAETIGGVTSGYGFTSSGTAYDDEDRLTGYQQASTNFNQSWALTSVGDWSSVTTNGTAVTRTHGPTHELLTSGGQNVTTDVKGNQTVLPASLATQAAQLSFAWDYDNKLKSSDIDNNGSADVTFEYDALGRRVARTQGSTAVVCFQADQQTIADYPRGGSASTATYRYVFASYIDEPVVRKTTGTSGTVLYYHRNQQYSIYALTDSSGAVSERYAYTAYGQPTFLNASAAVQTSSAANNRYMYTAREWDATLGLHHFRARWMSGLTGRFLTRDPIGFEGSPWNIYEFLESMALSYVDPSGLEISLSPYVRACMKEPTVAKQIECLKVIMPEERARQIVRRLTPTTPPVVQPPVVQPPVVQPPVVKPPLNPLIYVLPGVGTGVGLWKLCQKKPDPTPRPDPRHPDNKPVEDGCVLIDWQTKPPESGKKCWYCLYMCPGAAPIDRYQQGGCHKDAKDIEGWYPHQQNDCENADPTNLPPIKGHPGSPQR